MTSRTTRETTTVLDESEFAYALDGRVCTGPPNQYWTGNVWWLYETAEPSVYVVIVGPRMESDCDDDGHVYYAPTFDELLVLSPDGERSATDDELDSWESWYRDAIREGYCD